MRTYDDQNDRVARLILARPWESNRLLIDWAQKYTARRIQESREFGS